MTTMYSCVLVFQGCYNAGVSYLKENTGIIIGFGITLCVMLVSTTMLVYLHGSCQAWVLLQTIYYYYQDIYYWVVSYFSRIANELGLCSTN